MQVLILRLAQDEIRELSERERLALRSAIEKLVATEGLLGFPHTSAVVGAKGLRELRPRQGRSRVRANYARVGDRLVIAAVGPEAQADRRGFDRAVRIAGERLDAWRSEPDARDRGPDL